MSLLQELQQDTRFLLKYTGASREQMNEFLDTTGLFLSDILYNESKYNLFVEWLENTDKIAKNLLMVNYAMIEYLVDKYSKGQKYTKGEMLDCYAYDPKTRKYYSCINSGGDCFVEEYNNIQELHSDFN